MQRHIIILIGAVLLLYTGCDIHSGRKKKVKLYYPNGNLKETYWLVNGKEEGVLIHYYEDGKIQWFNNFSKGKKVGIEKEYFINGNVSHINYYKNGTLDSICYRYYENGNLRQWGHILEGKFFLDAYVYYPNGNRKWFYFYNAPDSLRYKREYDEAGNLLGIKGDICAFYTNSNQLFRIGDTIVTTIFCAEPPDVRVELYILNGCDWPRIWEPINFQPNRPFLHQTIIIPPPDSLTNHDRDSYHKYKIVIKDRISDTVQQELLDSIHYSIVTSFLSGKQDSVRTALR